MSHFSLFDLDRSLAIMEISLGLVRRTHLRNGMQLSADELASLDIIQLNSMNIATIDNLEVFDQIRELHLSRNVISRIENLIYLNKLEYLDLSHNRIDDEGLVCCIGSLPSSLLTLNLDGNPCCRNAALLEQLNDSLPNLGIIVGVEEEQTEESKGNGDDDDDDDEDDDDEAEEEGPDEYDNILSDPNLVLNAETILKQIVERKMKFENLGKSNIDFKHTTKELDDECERALNNVRRRRDMNTEVTQKKIGAMTAWGSRPSSAATTTSSASSNSHTGSPNGEGGVNESKRDMTPRDIYLTETSSSVMSFLPPQMSQVKLTEARSELEEYLHKSHSRALETKQFLHNMKERYLKKHSTEMDKVRLQMDATSLSSTTSASGLKGDDE